MQLSSVTLVRNIPLMRQQNIGIGWNGLMLPCYLLMLHHYSYSILIHTCSQWCYVKPCIHQRAAYALRRSHAAHIGGMVN